MPDEKNSKPRGQQRKEPTVEWRARVPVSLFAQIEADLDKRGFATRGEALEAWWEAWRADEDGLDPTTLSRVPEGS